MLRTSSVADFGEEDEIMIIIEEAIYLDLWSIKSPQSPALWPRLSCCDTPDKYLARSGSKMKLVARFWFPISGNKYSHRINYTVKVLPDIRHLNGILYQYGARKWNNISSKKYQEIRQGRTALDRHSRLAGV